MAKLNNYGWTNILDGYEFYPPSFQRTVPYLFASLVYYWHKNHFPQLFPDGHPIYMQQIFTNLTLVNSLKDKVILAHAYCDNRHMSAQGVPVVIMISREAREFRKQYGATIIQEHYVNIPGTFCSA